MPFRNNIRTILSLFLIFVLAFVLRSFRLGTNPPHLYWDEASLGYNAYLIATSAHDEHGEFLPLARFIAFGDYKPPGYIYATVPSILIFGLDSFAVRFPSMLSGFFLVVLTYLLVYELFKNRKIAFLSSFFLAISPWAIQFSRAAFEANLAALFNLAGVYFFLLSKKKKWSFIPSLIFFILSFYTFNANRIIAPLLIIVLSVIYYKTVFKNLIWYIVAIIIAFLLVLPSARYFTGSESKLRFQEVSIFTNPQPVEKANERIALDNNLWWAKIIHNRRLLFGVEYLKHYFDNFTGKFLFTHGDINPRLSIQEIGELYVWDLPFLILGIYLLVKTKNKAFLLLLSWVLIVPIPAATARETPHALRIASILPTYQIFIAFGLYHLFQWFRKRVTGRNYFIILTLAISFSLMFNFYYYLHNYYVHYPVEWSGEWQYGYKEMVKYVDSVKENYDQIYVTEALGRPYIYFAFYKPYSYNEFLKERVAQRDWFGFWNVKQMGKIKFGGDYKLSDSGSRILIVTPPNKFPSSSRLLKSIKNLSGQDVFLIGEKL